MNFRENTLYLFLAIRHVFGGVCDPGTIVYAPYPGTYADVQATALSSVIDGLFLVQWTGSPNLCNSPSSRALCVVDASMAYNGNVCDERVKDSNA